MNVSDFSCLTRQYLRLMSSHLSVLLASDSSDKKRKASDITTVAISSSSDESDSTTSSRPHGQSTASVFATLLATVDPSALIALMVGSLTCNEEKVFTMSGVWSTELSHLSSSALANVFEHQAIGHCWDGINHPPSKVMYRGEFVYGFGAEQRTVPDESELSFEPDNEGGFNICGTGQSKFGSYTVTGKMTSDKRIVMVRCDQPEQLSAQEQRDFDDNFSHFIPEASSTKKIDDESDANASAPCQTSIACAPSTRSSKHQELKAESSKRQMKNEPDDTEDPELMLALEEQRRLLEQVAGYDCKSARPSKRQMKSEPDEDPEPMLKRQVASSDTVACNKCTLRQARGSRCEICNARLPRSS